MMVYLMLKSHYVYYYKKSDIIMLMLHHIMILIQRAYDYNQIHIIFIKKNIQQVNVKKKQLYKV